MVVVHAGVASVSDPERLRVATVERAEWETLRTLAATVWHEHYGSMLSREQIAFMLSERFSDAGLQRIADNCDDELAILWLGEQAVGYCGSGPDAAPHTFKLGQLYVLAAMRGQGLGRLLLAHVERRAIRDGASRLVLQVNKQNTTAIGFYRRQGFSIREAAVFDIGNGFVMDDYVMEKPLHGILPAT